MMKQLLTSACLIMAHFGMTESIQRDYYIVVSDKFDENVKSGTCVLTGTALDIYEKPISGGTVSNFDRTRSSLTDNKGRYSLILSSQDTALFFYHENYGEVIIWNYNFQSQHRVEINFISMEHSDIPVVQEKPVIYLYSDNETEINLSLDHSDLSFTYPAYNDGWIVKANSTGQISNLADGKKYPYLFWEGLSSDMNFKTKSNVLEGNLVATNDIISFLEISLAQLGLNSTESTDFITYWGPRFMEREYAFIQFLIDEEVDKAVAGIDCQPAPVNQRRVYMLYSLLDEPNVPFKYETQVLKSFSRSGFTLVEWGGSELKMHDLLSDI